MSKQEDVSERNEHYDDPFHRLGGRQNVPPCCQKTTPSPLSPPGAETFWSQFRQVENGEEGLYLQCSVQSIMFHGEEFITIADLENL